MQTWILLAIGIGVIVVASIGMVLLGLVRSARATRDPATQGKYPQGHWMSIGMLVGVLIGSVPAIISILMDRASWLVAMSPAMGLGIGVAIGSALEQRHKDELRPLTEEEKRMRSRVLLVALGTLALLVLSVSVLGGALLFASR